MIKGVYDCQGGRTSPSCQCLLSVIADGERLPGVGSLLLSAGLPLSLSSPLGSSSSALSQKVFLLRYSAF